jgi:hypothetical protein
MMRIPLPTWFQAIVPGLALLAPLALMWALSLRSAYSLYQAVPNQTPLVFEIAGVARAKAALSKSPEAKNQPLLQADIFQHIWGDTQLAAGLLSETPDAASAIATTTLLAAVNLHASDSLHALFITHSDISEAQLAAAQKRFFTGMPFTP